MPFPIPALRLRRLLSVFAAAMLVSCLAPALASACTMSSDTPTQAFSSFGDQNWYWMVPNGDFTDGGTGWTFTHASLVSTDGPGLVSGDGMAGEVAPSGSLTSPAFCIDTNTPTVRFMARLTSPSMSGLMIKVLYVTPQGFRVSAPLEALASSSTSWVAVPPADLSVLPHWEAGQTLTVRLQLVPIGGHSRWQITDLFADPYAKS